MCQPKTKFHSSESRELFRICKKHHPNDMPDLQGRCIICEHEVMAELARRFIKYSRSLEDKDAK